MLATSIFDAAKPVLLYTFSIPVTVAGAIAAPSEVVTVNVSLSVEELSTKTSPAFNVLTVAPAVPTAEILSSAEVNVPVITSAVVPKAW